MSRVEKTPLGTTAEYIRPSGAVRVRAELSCPHGRIEPANLSTVPAVAGTKDGDTRFCWLRCVSDGKSTLGDNGGVQQARVVNRSGS